jgi:hypothetical protein
MATYSKSSGGKTGKMKNKNKCPMVVTKPTGRVGGTNKEVKVNPAPGKKGGNKK